MKIAPVDHNLVQTFTNRGHAVSEFYSCKMTEEWFANISAELVHVHVDYFIILSALTLAVDTRKINSDI